LVVCQKISAVYLQHQTSADCRLTAGTNSPYHEAADAGKITADLKSLKQKIPEKRQKVKYMFAKTQIKITTTKVISKGWVTSSIADQDGEIETGDANRHKQQEK